MAFKSAKWPKAEQNQNWDFHRSVPVSKSYPEIESTWPTANCRWRKPFETWYYIVTCAPLCISFSSKSKAINVFLKRILKSKARDQSNQTRKKLFCLVTVKIIRATFRESFWWKSKARRGSKSKKRHLRLYCTVAGLSEAATGGVVSENYS